MQSATDPAKWEALEILATDPSQHFRTELDTEGAVRRRDEGGFMIVPSRQYNSALADVSEAIRRKREAPPPPSGSSAKAADVAREADAEGRSVGPAMMAELGDDRAALAGQRVQPRSFRKPSPEMLAQAEAEQEGFQQGLRLRGEPPARGDAQSRPRVAANGVGDMPAFRPPTALRPPSDQSEPVSEAEGVTVRTATPTRDEEFAAAQDEANRRGLMAGLGRAGARLNEAFTGVGGDTAFYDQLARESDNPVRQLLAQREADKRRALEDPSSEQSQRIQAWVSKALPGVYTQEEISQMTAGDADAVTRYGEMRQRLDQRAAERAAMQTQRADDISREDRIREDEQTFRATEAQKDRDLQRELARRRGGAGGRSAAQTAAAQNRLEADIQKAGEDLEGAGTLASDLDFLDQMAARDDIPGVGRWDSKKTGALSFLASDDDTRTMQTMRSVVGRLLKERSGTAASDAEVERVMTELGMGPDATEQQFKVGVKRLRQDVGNALATKQARYRPEVVQTYRERGGKTAQDIAPRAAGRQVEMIAPDGTPGFVDAAEVAEAEANGYRRKA